MNNLQVYAQTTGYNGTLSATMTKSCGGHYIPSSYNNCTSDTSVLIGNHTAGCKAKISDSCDCGNWVGSSQYSYYHGANKYVSAGTFRAGYHIEITCYEGCRYYSSSADYGNGKNYGHSNRWGSINYKCDRCGASGGSSEASSKCNATGRGHWYSNKNAYGQAVCADCGNVAGSGQPGLCTVSKSQACQINWSNTVSYTYQNSAKSMSVTSNKSVNVDYNSNATITFNITNTNAEVTGYRWYKNGTLISGKAQSPVVGGELTSISITLNNIIDSGNYYQLELYCSGWESYAIKTSPIYIDAATKLKVYDHVESSYASTGLTGWKNITEGNAVVNDLNNGNNIKRDGSYNIGLFVPTSTSISAATTNGDILKGWPTNSTISTSAKTNELFAGSGCNTTVNNYHKGYTYKRATSSPIPSTEFGVDLHRYFTPITYYVQFNGYKNTGQTAAMSKLTFTYDRGQTLPANTFIRRYYVTLKNTEPWLTDLKASNGNNNTASKYINYSFMGWKLNATTGSSPYYEVANSSGLYANQDKIGNVTTTSGGTATMYATWKSNTITLPNTITGSNGFTFLNWSNKAYPDTRVYNKSIASNVDDVNYTVAKNTAYKPYKDTTLYAHWYKDVTLTFNLNGGKLKQNGSSITLKGTFYDYEPGYTFNIYKGLTSQSKGRYDTQINTIDAYGTYNSNGENKLYTKVSSDGTYYRFLGWSLNPNATEPDSDFDEFNPNRKTTYTIYNDTTLYAVWEPVLQANIETSRTLGNLTFDDGTKPVTNLPALNSSKGEQSMSIILRPGEQGFYRVDSTGSNNLAFKIAFDTRITDIYTHGDPDSDWFDELNPSTHEDLQNGQGYGLDRQITGIKNFTRKFHIPQYLGTDRSYDTSNPDKTSVPVNKYVAVAILSQPSYYYNSVYGKDEQIIININIYISPNNSSDFNNVEDKLPSIISEIRTRIL